MVKIARVNNTVERLNLDYFNYVVDCKQKSYIHSSAFNKYVMNVPNFVHSFMLVQFGLYIVYI